MSPTTHCAECHADLARQPKGNAIAGNPLAGQLLNPDGTPHRLTCEVGHRHYHSAQHDHRCDDCGERDCLLTSDRRGELHRCQNPACKTWRYQHQLQRATSQRRLTL